MTVIAATERRRVLLLLEHDGNRRRLARWLDEEALEAVAGAADPAQAVAEADLVLVDAAGFAPARELVAAARRAVRPAFLPCLLVLPPGTPEVPTAAWEIADDVVVAPVRPADLRVRVARLLELRAASLATAREDEELRRSNVDLERFAFVAAHELNSPLAIVSGALLTVRHRYAGRLDATADRLLEAGAEACVRMQALIDDILAYSRVHHDADATRVATGPLVADVLAELAPDVSATGGRVEVADLPVVRGDEGQLRLVFRNLVANALKYHRDGHEPHVVVDARRDGEHWRFCVTDDGVGIPDAARDAVFELFERGGGVDHRPGSGIGLAICRRIVEAHGGRIWVEARDPGSAFCFTLRA